MRCLMRCLMRDVGDAARPSLRLSGTSTDGNGPSDASHRQEETPPTSATLAMRHGSLHYTSPALVRTASSDSDATASLSPMGPWGPVTMGMMGKIECSSC